MKTYILIPLAVLSLASVALSHNEPYLLATVLFYNDGKSQIVGAGRIPHKIRNAIKKDIVSRVGNTTERVVLVPLFNQVMTAPAASEVKDFVRQTFHYVYSVEIPKWLASKVVYTKSKKMILNNIINDRLDIHAKDTHNAINEEALNTNSISEGKLNETSIDIANVPKTYYIPNTIFYAVDTKCVTPNDYTCYLNNKTRHIKGTHYKTFKTIFKKATPKDLQF